MKQEAVRFLDENGTEQEFYVEEATRMNGTNYLLVTDSPEEEASALILKDIAPENSEEAQLVPVEDPEELEAILPIFEELMEDVEIDRG